MLSDQNRDLRARARHTRKRKTSVQQLDLFTCREAAPPPSPLAFRQRPPVIPDHLTDDALLIALDTASIMDLPALAAAAGTRRLQSAIPVLAAICRRVTGLGDNRIIPEQIAALEALSEIGGKEAQCALRLLLTRQEVRGPGLATALACAARLDCHLPATVLLPLLRHDLPGVRAAACRGIVTPVPEAVPVLLELRHDVTPAVALAALCALGRSGRREALSGLRQRLTETPTAEVITAAAVIADGDIIVMLGRLARGTTAGLATAAWNALAASNHPQASHLLEEIPRPSVDLN